MKEAITPVRLHLELVSEHLSDDEKRMLKRYGESSTGETITRDVLVPSDMNLHALHYMIQKLFGWQNSHLRRFVLPKEVYNDLIGGTVKGWSDLVGVLFQPPSEAERDLFWDDDYSSGSFSVWLRKKYTGPYVFEGYYEQYEAARKDVEGLLNQFKSIEVRESFSDYLKRTKDNPNAEPKVLRKAPLIDLTLEEMRSSLRLQSSTESLMEKLLVAELLAFEGEGIGANEGPVTTELLYQYDFGDDWTVRITKKSDCDDLVREHWASSREVEEAEEVVLSKHKPVCLSRDRLSVMDDVGGLSGFANFLGVIYEYGIREEAADLRRWAKSMGWNQKKLAPKGIL